MTNEQLEARARANAAAELRAFAALIRRPPLDDVQIEQQLALRIASAIEVTLAADQSRAEPVGEYARGIEAAAKVCQHVREIIGAATGSSIGMALAEASDRIRALAQSRHPGAESDGALPDAGVGL